MGFSHFWLAIVEGRLHLSVYCQAQHLLTELSPRPAYEFFIVTELPQAHVKSELHGHKNVNLHVRKLATSIRVTHV